MINERTIKNHRNLRCAQQNVRMILLTTKVTTALHFLHDIEIYYHYHTYILYHLFAIKLINYPDGMQQLLVESEGGTVLIDCTNVTIVKADQPQPKKLHPEKKSRDRQIQK